MADVFGRMVADYYDGELAGQPIYERSDGHEQPAHCAWYFSEPAAWPAVDRDALALAGERATAADRRETVAGRQETVLDLGCGPGRAGLFLQVRGHDVVGVDASPRTVEVARDRGVEEAVVGELASLPLGPDAVSGDGAADGASAPDSAVAFGSHVGAGGTPDAFRSLLRDLGRVFGRGGRIVADCYDPTRVTEPGLASYLQERAIDDGLTTRRFRLRYDGAVGPWRTLLCCSPGALERLVEPTDWRVADILRSDGSRYWFVLELAGTALGPSRSSTPRE